MTHPVPPALAAAPQPAVFDVYGFRFALTGSFAQAIEGVRQDFAFFASSAPAESAVTVELWDDDPPRAGLPQGDAAVYTPRNVVYRESGRRFVDYHGRALGIQDEPTGAYRIYGRDPDLVYEAAYLYLLSRIGDRLDRAGLHRLHALAVEIRNRAVLVLLPMGGGKSTLGLHLMRHPEVRILSDDSPFIDRRGRALAYPLRLGLLPGSEDSIPTADRRVLRRMEFGPKHLVNYSFFQHRVCPAAEPGLVFIGARRMGPGCSIEEVGLWTGLRACLANCVIGIGLFQGLEFLLRSSAWELAAHAGVGLSRFRNCLQLLRRSRVCLVHLGSDPAQNARTVLDYASSL